MDAELAIKILWGTLILTGLAFICGVGLAFASYKLTVKEDPRIAEVSKLLPGVNCGACGYAGCHALAEAIVKGDCQKLSACKVGKKDKNFEPIVAYLSEYPDEDGTKRVPDI